MPAQKCLPWAESTMTLASAASDILSINSGNSDQKAFVIVLKSSPLHIVTCAT